MAKIPQKFMGLLGKFADSLDCNDLPKGWADNPEIVEAAGELYRDMGTESPFFKAWFGNWPAAKAYHEVVSGRPVVTLTGKEFQKDGVPLTEKVPAWYDEVFRGAVRSPELGDVSLDLEGVKDSMGHGIGREKSAAFAAVPDIIRKGTVFDRQSNWKGRGYDTSVISAPVRIGDTDYAGEVVVKTGKDRQGLYLHEVEKRKRLEDAFKTANGSAPQASRLILGQKLNDVKRSSKVVDGEGRPLVVHHNTDAVFDAFSKDKISSRSAYGEGFYFAEKPAPYGPHQMDVYLKGTYGLPEKRAARRAGLPVHELDYVHVPDKGYWMVKEPNQIKSVQNRGTFNPDDPNIYKALPWAVGGAGAAAALSPDEAEAARPWNGKGVADIVEQIRTGNIKGGLLGRFSEDDLVELQKRNPEYTKPEHVMTAEDVAHVKNSRIDKPKQKHKKTPDQVGDMLNSITTSTRRRFVTTKEGHPTGIVVPHGNKTYLGILEPEEGGRAGIWTVYDPKTEKLPNKLGSLDSGSRNVPSNYAAEDGSFTQRQLSAVESGKKINSQNKLVNGAALLTGAGAAALAPGEAQAAQKGESGDGALWRNVMDEVTRGLGLGTRNVLEGLGRGATLGLSDPGKTISDVFGLPVPETDLEKRMAFLEGGTAEAVPMILGGGAMAKMAASPVTRGVGRELFATPGRDMALGGLLGSFLGGD